MERGKNMKKDKGISLITLAITIIVMIILATVIIITVIQEDGIIARAKRAKEEHNKTVIREEIELLLMEYNIKKYSYDDEEDMEDFLKQKLNVNQVTEGFGLQKFKYKGYQIAINEETKEIEKMEKTTEDIFVSENGQLYVEGSQLKNQYGHDMQLKGINIWAYDSKTFNEDFFKNLKETYGVNCVRLALNSLNPDTEHKDEQGRIFGYLYDIIDAIIANDMYVILDWHLINQGDWTNNPYDYEQSAHKVFTMFAQHYQNVPNLMYELANEPKGTWEELIPYYSNLTLKIREISPNSVILVSSAGHGLDVDAILEKTLEFDNIMYAMHFYYSNNYLEEMEAISKAILNGLCIFASEWAPTNGLGGKNELIYANALTNFMDNYYISSTYWLFTNGNTEYEKLTEAQKYAVNYISHHYEESSYSKYKYSIDDYTVQERSNIFESESEYNKDSLWHLSQYRDNIEKIIFHNYIELPDNLIEYRDVSKTSQGTIVAYITKNNNDNYDLHIAGKKIYFPKKSSFLFAFMKNVRKIENLKLVNTSNVEDFCMTFGYMVNLQEIDISNFNTSKVTNMHGMLGNLKCVKNIIGIEKIDVSNVTNMTQMLNGIGLTKLDLSQWNLNNDVKLINFFQGASALKELDISTWDFSKLDSSQYENFFVFSNVPRTIYVKDEYSKNVMQKENSSATVMIK